MWPWTSPIALCACYWATLLLASVVAVGLAYILTCAVFHPDPFWWEPE